MTDLPLNDQDIVQIQTHGITLEQVREHLRLFARPPRFVTLARPATVADGIRRLAAANWELYLARHAEASRQGRFTKFVPASGGATRMFEVLLHYFFHVRVDLKVALTAELEQGLPRSQELLAFFERLPQFAFSSELQTALSANGHNLQDLLADD